MCEICDNYGSGSQPAANDPGGTSSVQRANVDLGGLRYEADAGWAKCPKAYAWMEVAGVAVDSKNRVFVFNRGPQPVLVFDSAGEFLFSWGAGLFSRPHGITIGPDDSVYCSDDFGHIVRKFTPEGGLLLELGVKGLASDTGATSIDFRTIRRSAEPFNYPTNVALSASGDIYVADGYGNARIHKFSAKGELLVSWGTPGDGPGQFRIPHGLAIDSAGTIYVADRENCRIQLFSGEGDYLSEWRDIARPCQIAFDRAGIAYVAELGFRAGMWPGTSAPATRDTGGRVSVFDRKGQLLGQLGGGDTPTAPGDFFAPHDICVDGNGAIYVAEVVMSAGGNRGLVETSCHSLQKLSLIG